MGNNLIEILILHMEFSLLRSYPPHIDLIRLKE